MEAIKAQTKPRVKSSTSITGVTKASFFALVTGSQSPADLFKESVANTLDGAGISDVVITNIAESTSRARKLQDNVELDINFVVTVWEQLFYLDVNVFARRVNVSGSLCIILYHVV